MTSLRRHDRPRTHQNPATSYRQARKPATPWETCTAGVRRAVAAVPHDERNAPKDTDGVIVHRTRHNLCRKTRLGQSG